MNPQPRFSPGDLVRFNPVYTAFKTSAALVLKCLPVDGWHATPDMHKTYKYRLLMVDPRGRAELLDFYFLEVSLMKFPS